MPFCARKNCLPNWSRQQRKNNLQTKRESAKMPSRFLWIYNCRLPRHASVAALLQPVHLVAFSGKKNNENPTKKAEKNQKTGILRSPFSGLSDTTWTCGLYRPNLPKIAKHLEISQDIFVYFWLFFLVLRAFSNFFASEVCTRFFCKIDRCQNVWYKKWSRWHRVFAPEIFWTVTNQPNCIFIIALFMQAVKVHSQTFLVYRMV